MSQSNIKHFKIVSRVSQNSSFWLNGTMYLNIYFKTNYWFVKGTALFDLKSRNTRWSTLNPDFKFIFLEFVWSLPKINAKSCHAPILRLSRRDYPGLSRLDSFRADMSDYTQVPHPPCTVNRYSRFFQRYGTVSGPSSEQKDYQHVRFYYFSSFKILS